MLCLDRYIINMPTQHIQVLLYKGNLSMSTDVLRNARKWELCKSLAV